MKYILNNNIKNKYLSFKSELISIYMHINVHLKKKYIGLMEYF